MTIEIREITADTLNEIMGDLNIKSSIEKVIELKEKSDTQADFFNDFEINFIKSTHSFFQAFGDATRYSEKQTAVIDRMHYSRITRNLKSVARPAK